MIQLRPYQVTLEQQARDQFRVHRRVMIVASTGAGKTRTFASIAAKAAAKGKRIVILGHRSEIIEQIGRALADLGIRTGWVKPGHTMTNDLVQIASVATLARRLNRVPEPDLVIVDECHHALAGTWEKIAAAWPNARYLGATATPIRSDGRGLGAAFDTMVEAPPMAWLIEQGFLAGYTYLAPKQVADLSGVSKRMGDYAVDELATAMDKATVTGSAVAEYAKHLAPRPAIVFAVNIAHAQHIAEQFREAGFKAASVDGTMEPTLRRDLLASIGDGRLNILTSCSLVQEGTDLPEVAGAILLRPTASLGLYLQMVGRCLRVKKDGSRAIILDHVGAVHRHGLPDMPREWSLDARRKKPSDAKPVSTCKACFQVFPAAVKQSPCVDEPACLFGARAPRPRELEQVEGDLVAIDADAIAAARSVKLSAVLTGRETLAELQAIGKRRGYNPKWAFMLFKERRFQPKRTEAA